MEDECVEALGRPISSLKVAELRDELTKRSLTKSGNKKELIDRLRGAILRTSSGQTSHTNQHEHHHVHDNLPQSIQSIDDNVIANQQLLIKQRIDQLQQQQQQPSQHSPYATPPTNYDIQHKQQLHQVMMSEPLDLQQHPQKQHYQQTFVPQSSISTAEHRLEHSGDVINNQPPIDMRVNQELNLVLDPKLLKSDTSTEVVSTITKQMQDDLTKDDDNTKCNDETVNDIPQTSEERTATSETTKTPMDHIQEPEATKLELLVTTADNAKKSELSETNNPSNPSLYSHEITKNDDTSQQQLEVKFDLSQNDSQIHQLQIKELVDDLDFSSSAKSNSNENSCMIENRSSTSDSATDTAVVTSVSSDHPVQSNGDAPRDSNKTESTQSLKKDKKRRWSSKTDNDLSKQQSSMLSRGLSSQKLLELIPDLDANSSTKQSNKVDDLPIVEVKDDTSLNNLIGTDEDMEEELSGPAVKVDNRNSSIEDVSKSATIDSTDKINQIQDDQNKLKDTPEEAPSGRTATPAKNEPSPVLFIQNLVRPFTLGQLKEVLTKHGPIAEGRFWTDRVKSKCCVQYESVEVAKISREFLHGQQWPSSNLKTLNVEFTSVKDLDDYLLMDRPKPILDANVKEVSNEACANDNEDDAGVKVIAGNAPSKSIMADRLGGKLEDDILDDGKLKSETLKANKDSLRNRLGERLAEDDLNHKRKHTSRSPENSKRQHGDSHQVDNEENGKSTVKMLDDLFQKTVASPCIFWLPLTEEQIAEREKYREEMRKKREQKHLSSGLGDIRSRDDRNTLGHKKVHATVSRRRSSPSPRRKLSESRRSRSPRRPRRASPPSKTVYRSSSEVSSGSSSRSRRRRRLSPRKKSMSRSVSRTPSKFRQSHSVRSPMRPRPSRSPPRIIPRDRGSRIRPISPIQTKNQSYYPNRREPQGYQPRVSPGRQLWMNRQQQVGSIYPNTGQSLLNRGANLPISRPLLPRRSRSRSRDRNEDRFRGATRQRPLY